MLVAVMSSTQLLAGAGHGEHLRVRHGQRAPRLHDTRPGDDALADPGGEQVHLELVISTPSPGAMSDSAE